MIAHNLGVCVMLKYLAYLTLILPMHAQALTYASSGNWDQTSFYYCSECGTTSWYDLRIETDGSIGIITEVNIVSWEIEVAGTASQAALDAGKTTAMISSKLPGSNMVWSENSRLHVSADGILSTQDRTDILLSNVFDEGDKDYWRDFWIGDAKMKASSFQYDNGPRDDTFGIMADSRSDFSTTFVLGTLLAQPAVFAIPQTASFAAVSSVPLPASALLSLLGLGSLISIARFSKV